MKSHKIKFIFENLLYPQWDATPAEMEREVLKFQKEENLTWAQMIKMSEETANYPTIGWTE